jgi:hypothetical protein
MHILARLQILERKMNMVQADVATLQADVATLQSNVKAIQAEVTDLLAKQGAAIDAADLAAIKTMHDELSAANAALAFTIGQDPLPAPAA